MVWLMRSSKSISWYPIKQRYLRCIQGETIMKRLILHVGTHKTGTTSLQRFMMLNAELISSQGVFVPQTPCKYPRKSRDRNACFLDIGAKQALAAQPWHPELERKVAKDKRYVKKALKQNDTIYLSDERIWFDAAGDPRIWDEIKTTSSSLGIDEIIVVVYLRRQDDLVTSLWTQTVKRSATVNFKDYLKRKGVKRALDYRTVLDEAEKVFGTGNIIVRVFDRSEMIGGDICCDFIDAIGLEWDDSFEIPTLLNPSLSNNAAEIKRITNCVPSYQRADDFLYYAAINTTVGNRGKKTSLLSVEEREALNKKHAAGNEEIARKYLGRDDGTLFKQVLHPEPEWSFFTPDMLHDICYFYSEAIAVEHEKNRQLAQEFEELQREVELLSGRMERLEGAKGSARSLFGRAKRFLARKFR